MKKPVPMMTPPLKTFVLIAVIVSFGLSGCTRIVDATTSKPIEISESQRSFGSYVDDRQLEVVVGVNLRKADPVLKKSNIQVTSYRGVILLTGQVPTIELKRFATKTASAVSRVRQVHNELQVNGNSAFLVRSNDAWIAAKVKAVLIADDDVDDISIKSVVEDGVVYLMGRVSQEVASQAVNRVRNISGVKEVVRVFEYIQ